MSCRALRSAITRINKRTGRSRAQIESRDIRETRIGSLDCSGPRRWNQRRSSRNPVVTACADTTRNPTYTRLQHNLVDRCTTDAEEHVVVHFETFNPFENLDAWT